MFLSTEFFLLWGFKASSVQKLGRLLLGPRGKYGTVNYIFWRKKKQDLNLKYFIFKTLYLDPDLDPDQRWLITLDLDPHLNQSDAQHYYWIS